MAGKHFTLAFKALFFSTLLMSGGLAQASSYLDFGCASAIVGDYTCHSNRGDYSLRIRPSREGESAQESQLTIIEQKSLGGTSFKKVSLVTLGQPTAGSFNFCNNSSLVLHFEKSSPSGERNAGQTIETFSIGNGRFEGIPYKNALTYHKIEIADPEALSLERSAVVDEVIAQCVKRSRR